VSLLAELGNSEKGEIGRMKLFERDGFQCVRCGDKRIQWAHIFSRVHRCLRWEADNALSLCGGCHIFWHKYPILAVEWFRKNWPERYTRIVATFQVNPKVRPADLLAERRKA
jgi:5-methylcytosine-specific restriction endonuclease McrA